MKKAGFCTILLKVALVIIAISLIIPMQALSSRKKNISIIPGEVCSSSGRYKNYIRLGCGSLYNQDMEKEIETLRKSIS